MKFRDVPKEEWPKIDVHQPTKSFENSDFLVLLFAEEGMPTRLTVNRTTYTIDVNGTPIWKDGITWDELQEIKNSVGFKDSWMVEVYPPDDKVVNHANMRHLWLLPKEPDYGWK